MDDQLTKAYAEVKAITKKYGTSYYVATRFLPKPQRLATYSLYGFFRIPDEYVDNPEGSIEDAKRSLDEWQAKWHQAYEAQTSDHPVLWVTSKTFHQYDIPFHYGDDFLDAMKQDLWKERYETYQDLQTYMYGSASVVGLMMSYVIGFEKGALPYAEKLGEAMQMTNFLRDIKEDYQDRNRIYLPQEDLDRFEVTEEQIKNGVCDENFISLMKFEIERTRALYQEAEPGIDMLTKEGRFGVRMASRLYEAILDKIEQADYNVFESRVYTKKREKLRILGKELVTWV